MSDPFAPAPLDRTVSIPRMAILTGFKERRLRDWCRDGKVSGAHQPADYAGSWRIPVRTLLGVFRVNPAALAAFLEVEVADLADSADSADSAETRRDAADLKGSKHGND